MKALSCAAVLLSMPPAVQAQGSAPAAPVESVESTRSAADKPAADAPELDPATKALVAKVSAFKYETGEVKLQAGRAKLTLPEGYTFLGPKDGKVVIEELWGNPPGSASDIEGIVIPRGQDVTDDHSWAIIVQFEDDGYVSDEDADDIDYDDLLTTLKKSSAEASKRREAAGYGKMLLTGWALPPRYDKEKKVLYWAKEFEVGGPVSSLNYDVRVLGRRGVLSMNAVASSEQKQEIDALTPEIVGLVTFNSGHTYAEYDKSTDKKADYTLAGLVVGGAVAAKLLAKGGFLVILAKFGKLLIIPVIAIGAWLKNKFSRS